MKGSSAAAARSWKPVLRFKPRQNKASLQGWTYADLLALGLSGSQAGVIQMDTVYNSPQEAYLQTFLLLPYQFLFVVFHREKTAASMVRGVDRLETLMSPPAFRRYAQALQTDRGPEFSAASALEHSPQGPQRTRVFYCDTRQAGQKGSLEKRHTQLRYVIPKSGHIGPLKLDGPERLNRLVSHLNSFPLDSLCGKSPFELMAFLDPELYAAWLRTGFGPLAKDAVILTPHLLH